MNSRLRLRAVVVMLVVAAFTVVSAASSRADVLRVPLTVMPSAGLADGQTLTVQGNGFDPATGASDYVAFVLLCAVRFVEPVLSTSAVLAECGQTAGHLSVDSGGSLAATIVVHPVETTLAGLTLTCDERPGECVVVALTGFGLSQTGHYGFVPITFGLPTPTSKAQCKNGGWRHLADINGVRFRNQGQCVSWFVHHHPWQA